MMNPHTGLRLAFALASFSLTLGSFAQRELSLVKAQTLGVENAYAMPKSTPMPTMLINMTAS